MRTWTFGIASLATAALLTVAGCGGSGEQAPPSETAAGTDETTTASSTTTDTTSSTTTDATAVKKGGILRIGTTDVISSFNPYNAQTLQAGVANSMVYPQLVQYGYTPEKGYEVVPDFAESWEVSEDGKTITFHTRPGATWSDGTPLTAEDAAWTINTTIEFLNGPTAQLAPPVTGVSGAEAIDDTTVVVHYEQPLGNALTLLAARLPVLPRHIWEAQAEGDGRGLRTFRPEAEPGGLVAGGAYTVKQYENKGTTVYVPNPSYYGTPSNAEAVALTYYTNQDAMLEDLQSGELDLVDGIPSTAVAAFQDDEDLNVVSAGSAIQADLFFNSNPRKPEHRELLDPRVREALAMCIDREQIIEVVFNGHAKPVETLVGSLGGEFLNTDLGPRPYDCDEANRLLDELGYERGADGVRIVPATTGEYAEAEHPMAYDVVTNDVTVYNVDRAVEILRQGWEQLGVKITRNVAGDEIAAWTYRIGDDCDSAASTGYTNWDMVADYSIAEVDPLNTLAGELKSSWCVLNFTGTDNAEYQALYEQALIEIDPEKRKDLIWEMQQLYFDTGATIPLAEEESIFAHSKEWAGFAPPEVLGYSKVYYTAPHQAG